MLPTTSAKFPALDSVTACVLLLEFTMRAAKVSVAGETSATGAVAVPVRLTVCVLPATPLLLSVIVSMSVLVPVVVGLKLTLMVQELPAARLPAHVLVWEKSPVAVMLVMVSVALPVLFSVTGCEVLVVPMAWALNVRLGGATLAVDNEPMVYVAVATGLVE